MVLSDDQYTVVRQVLDDLNAFVIRADDVLSDKVGFLTELAEKYGNCGGGVSGELASRVASRFTDNYAVITVLASDWLSRNNCDAGKIGTAIEEARREIYRFVKDYLWFAVLGRDAGERSAYAERLAPLIFAMGMGKVLSRRLVVDYLRTFGKSWDGMDNDYTLLWFTQSLEGTLREGVEELVKEAMACASSGGCTYSFGEDPNYIVYKVAEFLKKHRIGD